MGISLSAAARYDNVPTGIYQAKLVEITEPKEYKSTYDGKEKIQNKSRFVYEVTHAQDEDIVGERVSRFVNMDGRGPKSGLYKELKGLGVDPLSELNSDDLIGRTVQLVISVDRDNNGVWRSNITQVIPLNPPTSSRGASVGSSAGSAPKPF